MSWNMNWRRSERTCRPRRRMPRRRSRAWARTTWSWIRRSSRRPEVKRGGRRLDGGDKVIAASPKKGVQHLEMPELPPVPANFPEAFVERLKRLEERAEARGGAGRAWSARYSEFAGGDSRPKAWRCQAGGRQERADQALPRATERDRGDGTRAIAAKERGERRRSPRGSAIVML